ncbi:MAG: hypothetical protein K1X54_10835 [Flavobacteriales bacterium]|nr:hypothetical protein [Flavobacteriales bacterium]
MKWFSFLLLFFTFTAVSAQNIDEEDIVLYKKQRYGGLNLNMNGYGFTGTLAKYDGAYKLWLLNADLLFVKHEKETKTWSPINDPNARPYFYGKQNSFFTLRTGLGRKIVITEKLRKKSGVQVAYNWQTGPVFGFTKPVYLEIIYTTDTPIQQYYLEVEKFDPDRHYIDNIYGRASGLRGFDQLKFYPGAFFKFAFSFEYSNTKERLKGIETGAAIDVFAKRIPIMALYSEDSKNPKNHQLFFSLYINFFFGTKYDQK